MKSINKSIIALFAAFIVTLLFVTFGAADASHAAEETQDPKLAPPKLVIEKSDYLEKLKGNSIDVTFDKAFLKETKKMTISVKIAKKNGKKNKIVKVRSSDKEIVRANYEDYIDGDEEEFGCFEIVAGKPGKAELVVTDKYGAKASINVTVKKSFYKYYLRRLKCTIYTDNTTTIIPRGYDEEDDEYSSNYSVKKIPEYTIKEKKGKRKWKGKGERFGEKIIKGARRNKKYIVALKAYGVSVKEEVKAKYPKIEYCFLSYSKKGIAIDYCDSYDLTSKHYAVLRVKGKKIKIKGFKFYPGNVPTYTAFKRGKFKKPKRGTKYKIMIYDKTGNCIGVAKDKI